MLKLCEQALNQLESLSYPHCMVIENASLTRNPPLIKKAEMKSLPTFLLIQEVKETHKIIKEMTKTWQTCTKEIRLINHKNQYEKSIYCLPFNGGWVSIQCK